MGQKEELAALMQGTSRVDVRSRKENKLQLMQTHFYVWQRASFHRLHLLTETPIKICIKPKITS